MKNFETKLKPISSVRYVSRRQYHLPLLHHAAKKYLDAKPAWTDGCKSATFVHIVGRRI